MADKTLEVFVAVYSDETSAGVALRDLKDMEHARSIELIDAALVVRDAEGKVHYEETADPNGKKMAKHGAIAGGLVGLIFPPSIVVGAVVGGAGGGLWGNVRDKGFKDDELRSIGRSLPPGSSAIVAVAEDHVLTRLDTELKGRPGALKVERLALSA